MEAQVDMMSRIVLSAAALLSFPVFLFVAPATAQQRSASAEALLEEVVVTARRREESLQDLPLSIAALDAAAIEAQGIQDIEEMADFVPNVTLLEGDRANHTQVVIRGIGGGHPDPVEVFGSGMYIDGHYIPGSLGGFMSTLDIERVELLRGPQGTLFGKNVTGGAVNIITARPGPEFESSLTVRAAEDGEQDLRGMLNFPINDSVYGRVSAAKETFDGYYFNRHLGTDEGDEDHTAINAALRFEPGTSWTVDVSAFANRRRDGGTPVQCGTLDGGLDPETEDLETVYAGFADDFYAACDADAAAGTFITSSEKQNFSDIDTTAFFTAAQWESDGPVGAFDRLSVNMKASARSREYRFLQDNDGSFYAADTRGTLPAGYGINNWTRNAEFIVEGDVSERLSFTAGFNYFYDKSRIGDGVCRQEFEAAELDAVDENGDPINTQTIECSSLSGHINEELPAPGSEVPSNNQARVENDSYGLFGHLTYALTDLWDVDLGIRYTEDQREYWNMEWPIDGCDFDQSGRVLGDPSTTAPQTICMPTLLMSYDRAIGDGFFNTAEDTFDDVTPMISFTRHIEPGETLDSGMVYFLYSEGFLTGGFNAEINTNLPGIEPLLSYGPEHVSNYEVGFKGRLAGGNVQIAADIFYMDYTDKQEEIAIDNSDGQFGNNPTLNIFTNVASVDISGIELELSAVPWDGGFVSVAFGYLDNEYGDFSYFDPEEDAIIDESNSRIVDYTPDWTLNVGVEHEFALASGATITPRLNIYSQDDLDYLSGPVDGPPTGCNQDSYAKTGARVTYAPASGAWRATLFGNNITDEEIYDFCSDTLGVYVYRHQRPANWGLQFTADWGA
jgi:iron complex outermembrane receptor protein